jgi:hypothetical protein
MGKQTVTLDDLREETLEDLLKRVVRERQVLTVRLPDGATVAIQPSPELRPLIVLEGFVPEGWKDAVYQ